MPPFLNGTVFGLIFLFALGPAFFALIQTSIQQGFKKALFFAVGISASDVVYVVIVLLGLTKALENEEVKFWIAILGAAMLLSYAVYSWFKSPKVESETVINESNYAKHFLQGLFLNGLNPFIVVSWATWVSAISINFEYEFHQQAQFFGGMLVTILSMDIGKAFLANRLKHLINTRFIKRMNRAVAVILLLFTGQIVYFLVTNYA